jgi:hypothetical protein
MRRSVRNKAMPSKPAPEVDKRPAGPARKEFVVYRHRRELQRRDPAPRGGGTRATERVLTRKPRLGFYSSLGECVMLDSARLG